MGSSNDSQWENKGAPGISYFTPLQDPPAGTALKEENEGKKIPKLFTPWSARGLKMQNRIMLSPLCQYSAQDGHYTMWHLTHMGGIIQRGPGLSTVEATAILPEGRITPEDNGLWKDSQTEELAKIVEFAHSQNQKIQIQIGHAGRKASTVTPWLSGGHTAPKEVGGWPDNVYAPSAIPFGDTYPKPKAMTKDDIQTLKDAWVATGKRAIKAGFDAIEIHNAHGYLLHEFISPVSNHRTDEYGGSFENRVRLTLEVVDLLRGIMPKDMPLFLRLSATDWLEENADPELAKNSWKIENSIKLAHLLADRGVDVLDVSSGGNHKEQHIHSGPAYQAGFAKAIKKSVGDKLLVGSVGMINTATLAESLLEELDFVTVGRGFQKNPGLVFAWADELGIDVQMPKQIAWGFKGRAKPKKQD